VVYPATVFIVRGSNPEQQVVLGLRLEKDGVVKLIRLPLDKAPPAETYVLLFK
jgi:hypothetical protein